MEQVRRAGANITMLVEGHHGHVTVPTALGSALERKKSICW